MTKLKILAIHLHVALTLNVEIRMEFPPAHAWLPTLEPRLIASPNAPLTPNV